MGADVVAVVGADVVLVGAGLVGANIIGAGVVRANVVGDIPLRRHQVNGAAVARPRTLISTIYARAHDLSRGILMTGTANCTPPPLHMNPTAPIWNSHFIIISSEGR